MTEEWRDIAGYEGLYQVSNQGRVKSFKRNKEKILKPINYHNYMGINLYNHGTKQVLIHRLVAEAFIPNPNNLPQVNHKDENPKNNCVDNLEWCSCRYNIRYSHCRKICCIFNNKIIKTYNAIVDVKNDGFYISGVGGVCRGLHKTHKGFQWKYLNDET